MMDKEILYKVSYGMYIVSSKGKGKINGQIANTVFQVTSEPPQFSVCINKENLTHQFIQESRVFAVSILERDVPMDFIGHFGFKSGREVEKFKGIDYKLGITGAPVVIQNCLGYLECEVVSDVDVGTHAVFIGKALEAKTMKDGQPMTYAYYYQVKNGRSPKNAPTYIKEEKIDLKGANKMTKYKCSVCGYIYEAAENNNVVFRDLPDNWVCPVCGAGKDKFEKIN